MHKLLLGRDPIVGEALASQPTLSRFENDVTRGELLQLSEALFEAVLERHRRRRRKVRRITVELDVIRPTASRNSRSSKASTTPGATCRCWRS